MTSTTFTYNPISIAAQAAQVVYEREARDDNDRVAAEKALKAFKNTLQSMGYYITSEEY